jgi:alginate O-acetyltransferase complex protein AlgI
MVFASLTFLYIFLPATLAVYYLVPSRAYKNCVLILASLVFYAWGEPVWVSLLIVSATADFIHGKIIAKHRGTWQSRAALASSIVVNLGLLGAFKYSSMAIETANTLLGISVKIPHFALPIGISFYTFQTISYTIDVYRGDTTAQQSYWKFLLFVSLFHQLVAGPIVRYRDIAESIENRTFRLKQFSSGVSRFAFGLAKKVLIANVAGELAAPFLDGALSKLSVLGAWWGMLLFAVQIYFDFSGYSDMAIGLGRMFGFEYKENFKYPYISRSVSEFWRRWHISLGSFFRDYIYIPMGGNRRHLLFNVLVVWFLTGLWHGAGWNFVLWGLYYGALIYIEKQLARVFRFRLPRIAGHIYLLIITLFGWSLFYFTNLSRLWAFIKIMTGFGGAPVLNTHLEISFINNLFYIIAAVLLCLPVLPLLKKLMHKNTFTEFASGLTVPVLNLLMVGFSTVMLVGSSYNPFLYFRF